MQLRNNFICKLKHRSFFLRGKNYPISAELENKEFIITNLDETYSNLVIRAASIYEISFLVSKEIISLIDPKTGNLVIVDFQGNILFWEEPPKLAINYPDTARNSFLSTYFDKNEKYLWCVSTLPFSKVEIQLRQIKDYSVISRYAMEDPFGDSHFSFYPTNNPNQLALWVAAGQDGTQIYWLENSNENIICQESSFFDMSPPIFSPKGDDFLVLDNDENLLYRYLYPQLEEVGRCKWEADNDMDSIGLYYDYLNQDYAIVSSNEGRILLLKIKEMKIADEIIIENHEPFPVSHYYPILTKENHLCTDLITFEKIGDHMVFSYRLDENVDSKNWKDSLIIIPIKNFLTEISD